MFSPLLKEHVPTRDAVAAAVYLESIYHRAGLEMRLQKNKRL